MTDTQFNLLRILALPLALFFVAQWWVLPGTMERRSSETATVSATYSPYKGGQIVLSEATGETLVIWCRQATSLCKVLQTRSIQNLHIWILRPTLLREIRLVAAEEGERVLVAEAQQNALLSEAKLIQGGLALLFSALAGTLWYLSPFRAVKKRANAA